MKNVIKNHIFSKIIILLIFISLYIFLFCMAFNIAFSPCEPNQKEYEIFCFSSPFILPILISFYIYHWFINKGGNLVISYSKSLLTTIAILLVSLSCAIFFTNIVQTYLEHKYLGTKMYSNYFELKCGCDDYQLKNLLFSSSMSIGTFIGGLLLYSFIILIKKIKV